MDYMRYCQLYCHHYILHNQISMKQLQTDYKQIISKTNQVTLVKYSYKKARDRAFKSTTINLAPLVSSFFGQMSVFAFQSMLSDCFTDRHTLASPVFCSMKHASTKNFLISSIKFYSPTKQNCRFVIQPCHQNFRSSSFYFFNTLKLLNT